MTERLPHWNQSTEMTPFTSLNTHKTRTRLVSENEASNEWASQSAAILSLVIESVYLYVLVRIAI